MKKIMKYFALLTALAALFALMSVAAFADEPEKDPVNMALTFSPEIQLVVYADGEWNAERSGVYGYGESVTVSAPEVNNKHFSHWTADGSVISYNKDLTLTLNAHTTLYAVYASSAPEKKSAAGFTSITRSTDGNGIVFQAVTVPTTGTVDAAGILYSTTVSGSALTLDNESASKEAAVKSVQGLTDIPKSFLDENNCWSFQLTPTDENATCYARAYATIGGTPVYGDVKTIKLSELPDGVAMIANLEGFEPGINDALAGLTEGMHTVTYFANGGVGAPITQAYLGGTVTLRANSFTRDGYVFSGWSTSENGGGTTYTDGQQNVTLGETKQLYAQWRVRSSGGSSTATKTITAPVTGDTGTVAVTTTLKGSDATIAPLTAEQVDSIVGSGAAATTVAIDVSNLGTEVKTVTIPTETVKAIEAAVSDKTKDADSLTVKLTEGSVTFDADAVKAIAAETKGDGLKVNLDGIGTEKLNTAQKSAVSDLTVETVLDAYVTSGATRISDFKGGSATVSVKHTLKASQSPAGIVVWYVADNGTRTQIPASFRNGEVVFTVTHFSNYVIAYDAEKAAAAGKLGEIVDLDSSAWYADGVLWALNNGVMEGVGNNRFNPNGDTTRAMVVTMLWRMEGSPAYAGASEFTDVDADTWYTEAVRWASTEGIVTGYENPDDAGMIFNPNGAVTREQLATMLYRYAQYKKADVSANASLSNYGDAATVSGWAASAMQWAVGSGIINGIDGNLAPVNHATRAQVATMLMRYSTNAAK